MNVTVRVQRTASGVRAVATINAPPPGTERLAGELCRRCGHDQTCHRLRTGDDPTSAAARFRCSGRLVAGRWRSTDCRCPDFVPSAA